MKKEDIELAKQEFNRERERWTDLLLDRRFYYADLLTRIADRQINHILVLTTISVAIVSIVFPLTRFLIVPFILLVASIVLGTLLVLYTIFQDQKGVPLTRDRELKVYKKLQEASNKNYIKAYDGTLSYNDVHNYYYDLKQKILKELTEIKASKLIPKITDILYIFFLVFFFLGLIYYFLFLIFYRN